MEREMGLEPTTSSLGSRASFENKEQMRPWRCILTTASHRESSTYPKTAENGVNGVNSGLRVRPTLKSPETPPLNRQPRRSNGGWRRFMTHRKAAGFQQIGSLLREVHPGLIISKRRLRKVESIECVRLKRENAHQNLGFSSRPFVLCGLPVRRPPEGSLLHERRNGPFVLQVTGHPSYGLPWGQDRLVPIFLATQAIRQKSPQIMFESAAAMLDTFGMQQGGSQYRRLVASFQRIFGATIFFGTDSQSERAVVVHR